MRIDNEILRTDVQFLQSKITVLKTKISEKVDKPQFTKQFEENLSKAFKEKANISNQIEAMDEIMKIYGAGSKNRS